MSFDTNMSNTDEYVVTALQIFECCGVGNCGTIRVDALMDKFAPFVKTDKAEFTYLKTLLDPDQCNPEINVTKLAKALHLYSENQKSKVDLDESFNLRGGPLHQDSDSGISSDGLQLVEELQCELREKEHQANQLRIQLDFSDRQHDEAMTALVAECDSLRRHLTVVREENIQLSKFRAEYEELCERLCVAETSLDAQRKENDSLTRRNTMQKEMIANLEAEKITLQELLSKSKDECHRINEMYAARQSALIEDNEALRGVHAELSAKWHDHQHYTQQLLKEKLLLENELKDLLNKSNQTQLRLDRSIDVSYTEDQMLTALDTLNSDSRFGQEHRLLDEESFMSMFRDEPGRVTNVSLFDEIRLSFCNKSRINESSNNCERCLIDSSFTTTATQTDSKPYKVIKTLNMKSIETQTDFKSETKTISSNTQTDCIEIKQYKIEDTVQNVEKITKAKGTQTIGGLFRNRPKFLPKKVVQEKSYKTEYTQTDQIESVENNNLHIGPCHECQKVQKDAKYSELLLNEMEDKLSNYEDNLDFLQNIIEEGKSTNHSLERMVENLREKIDILQTSCDSQKDLINNMTSRDVGSVSCQTESDVASVSTQVETPCGACENRRISGPQRLRRFLWEPIKCLFQMFAVICFAAACMALYAVTRPAGCARALPWRWASVHDLVDLLLRIEYTSDVPM